MALKVLLLLDQFPPLWGSLSLRAGKLVKVLCKSGFYVTVIAPVGEGKKEGKLRVVSIPSLHKKEGAVLRLLKYSIELAGALASSFRLEKHDLVISSIPQYLLGVAGWYLAKRWNVPHIVEVRDLWPHSIVLLRDNVKGRVMWKGIYELSKFLFRRADFIVATNEAIKDELVKSFALNGDNLAVIRSPYEVTKWHPLPHSPRFFYGGNLGFSQNPELLVDVARRLSALLPEATIEVAGSGSLRDKFLRRVEEMECNNIRYSGTLPHRDVIDKIASSYACIVMLRDQAGLKTALPGKLIEAMSIGRPVVASLRGIGARVVEEAKAGVVVEPERADEIARALHWLWQNRTQAEKMGKNGISYVRRYHSEEKFAEAYIAVFKALKVGA